MRLRNIPGSREAIAKSIYTVNDPGSYRGKWNTVFENDHAIRMEIGMGKGRFLMDMAERDAGINFIGIEMYSSVLIRAVQKAEERYDTLRNFRLIRMDARELEEVFAPGEVDRIYLNFSDPWPKARHADRRLTSGHFLRIYEKILAPDGRIEFKTDNQQLFRFSLEELGADRWKLLACTWDLHRDIDLNRDNIMTEYEERFSEKGNPICKLVAVPPGDSVHN